MLHLSDKRDAITDCLLWRGLHLLYVFVPVIKKLKQRVNYNSLLVFVHMWPIKLANASLECMINTFLVLLF